MPFPFFSVLIPAYNPDNSLLNLVNSLIHVFEYHKINEGYEVVLVNDGSFSNESASVFSKLNALDMVKIINLSHNKGKGAALKEGLKYIKTTKSEYVVTADADGQHLADDIVAVLERSISKCQFIIGVRDLYTKGTPLKSFLGNGLSSIIFKIIAKKNLPDTQSGLRAFPSKNIDRMLCISGNRYQYELSVLLEFYGGKENICKINKVYINDNQGTSFRPIVDSIAVYSVFLRYCLNSFLITILDFSIIYIMTKLYPTIIVFIVIRLLTTHLYFFIMKIFTFKNLNHLGFQLMKFYALVTINIVISSSLFGLLFFTNNYNFTFSYISAAIVLFILNYFIQRNVIFK